MDGTWHDNNVLYSITGQDANCFLLNRCISFRKMLQDVCVLWSGFWLDSGSEGGQSTAVSVEAATEPSYELTPLLQIH